MDDKLMETQHAISHINYKLCVQNPSGPVSCRTPQDPSQELDARYYMAKFTGRFLLLCAGF